jgi:hypothetical protein
VAERVDLDHQGDGDRVVLAQIDQAVEDRFPVPVAREIVIRDKKFADALLPIEAHQMLDVVAGAEP